MAIVNDRLNAAKPQSANDPKKVTSAQMNNNKDLDVDAKKEEPSFFGSFFPGNKGQKKKGGPIMEAVRSALRSRYKLILYEKSFVSHQQSSDPKPH